MMTEMPKRLPRRQHGRPWSEEAQDQPWGEMNSSGPDVDQFLPEQ